MAILLTIPPEGKLVAKLFSEPTPSGIAKQQTAQHPTGAIEASVDVADGEIQPGGDFAEFKPAVVAEEQYLPMPVMQDADQSHQFDAGFRKDQRVERTRVVLGQEDGLASAWAVGFWTFLAGSPGVAETHCRSANADFRKSGSRSATWALRVSLR